MKDGPEEFTVASGARLAIPEQLRRAVRKALLPAAAQVDGESAEQVFVRRLLAQLHLEGMFLLPRERSGTREMVSADLYGMALSAKYAADERVHAVGLLFGPLPGRPSLCAEFQEVVDQLTGHAPPAGVVDRLGQFEERLRRLRYVALSTPIDAPMSDSPAEEIEAGEVVAELFRGEAR